jgi:putative spermidine/putrescine transport system permease protein
VAAGGDAERTAEGAAVTRVHPALWAYVALLSVYLLAPIVVVVVAAFTAADFIMFPPSGFSLKWFEKVLRDPDFIRPLWNSIRLGVAATVVSSLLAVPAAIALVRGALPGRRAIETFLLAPLTLPTIILAVGLLFFAARIGLTNSFAALLAGHVVITVPYMLRTVLGVYAGMNREVEEAAQVLGAKPWQVAWHVTLPAIRPGVIAGTIFSFLMSFDEVAVALLLTNSDTTTLPVSILSYLVYNYDPAVAAISTIQIAIVVAALVALERLFGVKNLMFTSR